jgi:hypothetical protein
MKDNTISVYNLLRQNRHRIVSHSEWFEPGRDIIVRFDWDKIVFKYPTLDYRGKTHKITKGQYNLRAIEVTEVLPAMREAEFDECSTDDCKVVYYT